MNNEILINSNFYLHNNYKRKICIILILLWIFLILPQIFSAKADNTCPLAITQTVSTNTNCLIGSYFDVTIDIFYSGLEPLLTLGVIAIVPEGLAYQGIIGGSSPVFQPSMNSSGTLEFGWLFVPPLPISFTYRLKVVGVMKGIQNITAIGVYGSYGDIERTEPVVNLFDCPVCGGATETTIVPYVIGNDVSISTSELKSAGLLIGNIVEECNDMYPPGIVFDQIPTGGETVEICTVVSLRVSTGICIEGEEEIDSTIVPYVIGKEFFISTSELSNVGLFVSEIIEECNDIYPEGIVFNQTPMGGETVEVGTFITLWVSTGLCFEGENIMEGSPQEGETGEGEGIVEGAPEFEGTNEGEGILEGISETEGIIEEPPGNITEGISEGEEIDEEGTIEYRIIPDVIGLSLSTALSIIEGADLTIGTTYYECSDEVPAGNVAYQEPTAGQLMPAGSPVHLSISSGFCTILDAQIDAPSEISRFAKDSLKLKVLVQGAHGTVYYQWYYSKSLHPDTPFLIQGAVEDSLSLTDLTVEDSGWYWCQVSDDYNVVETAPVRLHVMLGLNVVSHTTVIGIITVLVTVGVIELKKKIKACKS